MSYDEIHFCLHTANRYLWELLRHASLQILGLSQSSGDTISVLFKDILLHNLTQLSWLRNKIVILRYRLICSDSPVATSSYYCLLHLFPFSPAVIFHILILWLHYRGPWYSYYSHNHPWFINTESFINREYFMRNISTYNSYSSWSRYGLTEGKRKKQINHMMSPNLGVSMRLLLQSQDVSLNKDQPLVSQSKSYPLEFVHFSCYHKIPGPYLILTQNSAF